MPLVENNQGKRVDLFLYEILQKEGYISLSRSFLKTHWNNFITVNNSVPKPSYKLKKDDRVDINWQKIKDLEKQVGKKTEVTGEEGNLDILYEDDNYLVIDKEKGIVVYPGIGHSKHTVTNLVKGYLERKKDFDERLIRSGLVHRLDKGVSGIMVFAKTVKAQKSLQKQFEQHKTRKIYLATVTYKELPAEIKEKFPLEEQDILSEIKKLEEGNFDFNKSWYIMEGYIGRSKKNRIKMEFKRFKEKDAKKAVSYIKPVSSDKVLISIVTGRMHQIRTTLEYLGMNIKGDTLYLHSKGKGIPEEIELRSIFLSFYDLEGEYFSICKT